MLVIASDLHFADGTSGQTIEVRAFRVFREWKEGGVLVRCTKGSAQIA